MTTYSAISNSEIAVGSPITNTLMTKIRDNPLAIQENDGTAPTVAYATAAGSVGTDGVTQSSIANAAVGQGELKTAYQTFVDSAMAATSSTTTTLTEPQYTTGGVQIQNNTDTATLCRAAFQNDDTGSYTLAATDTYYYNDADNLTLYNDSASIITLTCRVRYITSSRPYDDGDGETGLYIFVQMDGANISTITCSEDPPWMYHGPTINRVTKKRNGIKYTTVRQFEAEGLTRQDLMNGTPAMQLRLLEDPFVDVEIDFARKRADMNVVPRFFTRKTVNGVLIPDTTQTVIIDPPSDMAHTLLELHQQGENVGLLFERGFLKIDNAALNRSSPLSATVHAAKWKVT